MLAQNAPASLIFGQLEDWTSGMQATSGGSSETDENVPTTIPIAVPSGCVAVIRVTPVGYCPRTYSRTRPGSSAPFATASTVVTVVVPWDCSCKGSVSGSVSGSVTDSWSTSSR